MSAHSCNELCQDTFLHEAQKELGLEGKEQLKRFAEALTEKLKNYEN